MTGFVSPFLIIIVLVNIIIVLIRKIINSVKITNITVVIIRITPVLHVKIIMFKRKILTTPKMFIITDFMRLFIITIIILHEHV